MKIIDLCLDSKYSPWYVSAQRGGADNQVVGRSDSSACCSDPLPLDAEYLLEKNSRSLESAKQLDIMAAVKKLTKELLVSNRCGVHLRVGAMLSKTANRFNHDTEITIRKGSYVADCRSVLDLLSLGAFQGDAVVLEVAGPDAEDAQAAITELFNARFHEDDGEII